MAGANTPRGTVLTPRMGESLPLKAQNLFLLCGHFAQTDLTDTDAVVALRSSR